METGTRTFEITVNADNAAKAEEYFGLMGLTVSEGLNRMLCDIPDIPDKLSVKSREELAARLDKALEQAENGQTVNAHEALKQLKVKYGL